MRKLFSIFVLSASLALAAPSTIVVQSGDTLGSIAARNGVSIQALLKTNGLSAASTLKIGQVLKLPGGSSSQKTGGITVQKGDTLGSIAKRYGVSVAALRAANGLVSDNVSVGQVLRLSNTVQSSSKTSSATAKSSSGTVTVKSGDTLGGIAQQNGTTVAALRAANELISNNLKLGQVLKLPGSSQSSPTSKTSSTTKTTSSSNSTKSSSGTVTVKAGDTLGEIAQANGTTVAALKAANGLVGNNLKLGQVLKLPGSSAVQSNATQSNTTAKTNTTTSSKTPPKNGTVTVKAGDNLSKIALANGTTISALRAKNGLTNDNLKLGQVLKLPSGNNPKPSNSSNTITAKSPSLPSSVQVQKGDSLSKIAKQFGLSIESLRKLNNLKSDDLALGQTLRLKPAPVLAKTKKPSKLSSGSKPSTNTTVTKTNQNKPVITIKPNTSKPNTSQPSTTAAKPNSSTTKPTTANKPNSGTTANKPSKPATTSNSQNKPSLAKTDTNKPATNQKPITTQTSSNPTKPTAQVSSNTTKPSSNTKSTAQASLNPTKPSVTTSKPITTPQAATTPKPEPVAVKPAPLKPATVSSNKPTPQPAIAAKPSQPIVSAQTPKPVMNEATVPETPVDTSTPEATPNSSDTSNTPGDPSAVTNDTASGTPSTSTNQDSAVPATQTEQSQSNVGSDADYIIIEPQNSLEIVGQRTGSALSTLPAKPPTNATPQQRAKYTRERLLWPLQGVLTSYYGYRRLRIGRSHFHTGLDIAAPSGTPVYAALSGRVEQAGWSRVGYGKLVIIRGWDGRRYYYGHNSRILVKTGQWINQGTMISKVGSTGYATGPHLHFEVRIGGQTRNPLAYLPRSQVQFARYAPKR